MLLWVYLGLAFQNVWLFHLDDFGALDAPRTMFILQGFLHFFLPSLLSKGIQLYNAVYFHFSCHIILVLQISV